MVLNIGQCLDITAPSLPNINLVNDYPSSDAIVKFKVNVCGETSHLLYKEGTTPPEASDSTWAACNTSTVYNHDLSISYIAPNHLRTISYWAKDLAGNVSPRGTFAIQYYPENLVINNLPPLNRLHVSRSHNFGVEGGVPSLSFTFDDGTNVHEGSTLSGAGEFTPHIDALGQITIKVTDSDLPSPKSSSYTFDLFTCNSSETFNLTNNQCYETEISCTGEISHSTIAKKTWNNTTAQYSSCVLEDCEVGYLEVANACQLSTYTLSMTQPTGNGLVLSGGGTTVNYDDSRTITYTPPTGFERIEWTGDCSGTSSNTCVLNNIKSNKTVGINVQCQLGYTLSGNSCVLNTYTLSMTQPTGSGLVLSGGGTTVNYGSSRTITYTPPSGFERVAWTGDCSGTSSNVCELSNITSNKTVGITVQCQVGYTLSGSSCNINTYTITLTQPSGNGLSVSGGATVNYGDSRTITYSPPVGYALSSWGGDCSGVGSGNTCVLSNVTSNKVVSVSIEQLPYDANISLAYGSTSSAQMDNCVSTSVTVKTSTGSNINRSSSSSIPITTTAGLSAYSDSGCSSSLSSLTIPSGQASQIIYLKNTATAQGNYDLNFNFTSFVAGRNKVQTITYNRPLDCRDAFAKGYSGSGGIQNTGSYIIDPDANSGGLSPFSVICEMGNSSWRAQQARGLTLVAAYKMSSSGLNSVESMSSVPSVSTYLSDAKYSGLLNNIGSSGSRYVIITTSSASNAYCTMRISTTDILRNDGRRLTTLQNNTTIRPGDFAVTNGYRTTLNTGGHNTFFHRYSGDSNNYTGYSYHGNGNIYLYVGDNNLYNPQPLTIWNGGVFVADNGTKNAYICGHSSDWLYVYIN